MIEGEVPNHDSTVMKKGCASDGLFFYDYILHRFSPSTVCILYFYCIGCTSGDGIIYVFLVPCTFVLGCSLVIIPQCMKVDKTSYSSKMIPRRGSSVP
jgi:hypothetical protein